MGQIALPTTGKIYVETSAIIYRVEQIEPYLTASKPLWDAVEAGDAEVVTSELTLLEVLVKPLRDGNSQLAMLYRQVLTGTVGINMLPISRAILEQAAQLRASVQLKTPDSIHAASASLAGVPLVTNDPSFRKVPSLDVALLSERIPLP